MACHEQEPIIAEVEKNCGIRVESINPLKEKASIKDHRLSVTPTILVFRDGVEVERFEGLVHQEQLEESIRRHL